MNITTIMKGKKTYLGIIMLLLGAAGLTDKISNAEVASVLDAVLNIVGTILAVYGRYEAGKHLQKAEAAIATKKKTK